MGQAVTVKQGYKAVLLPGPYGYRNYNAGTTVTLTSAEYANLNAATLAAVTASGGTVPDPARYTNNDPKAGRDFQNSNVSGAATATVGWNDWTLTGNVTSVTVNATKLVNNTVANNSITVNQPVYGASPGSASTLDFKLTQDSTGSRLVTWGSAFKFVGGSAPTLSTAAGKVDIIRFVSLDGGTTWYEIARALNVS